MLTDEQVRVLRRKLMEGQTQEGAAAAASISVRSARNWQSGPYPSKAHRPHGWRTRRDPFAEVFDSEIVPLLTLDEQRLLEARTLLGELERRHPGCFSLRHLRTLQRRLREWRALHGPEQEVYFPQEHRLNQAQHAAVGYALGHQREQFLMVDRPEKVFQIGIHDPLPPALNLLPDLAHRILGRAPSPIAEVGLIEYRLEAGLQSIEQRLLAYPNTVHLKTKTCYASNTSALHTKRIWHGENGSNSG
jgi:hypothetical protein